MATNEQISDLQRKNLEAAMRLAQVSIENSQRLMELQVDTARKLFDESVNNAKALASASDPAQMLELRGAYAQATTEHLMNAAQRLAQIAAESQGQLGQILGEQLTGSGREMMESLQKAMFNPGAGNAMGAMQQAFDAMRGAFEQMARGSTAAMTNLMSGQMPGQPGGQPPGKGPKS